MRLRLSTRGCAQPYMEAIGARLAERGSMAASADVEGVRSVVLVSCEGPSTWDELATLTDDVAVIVVAVLPELEVGAYARALSIGADGVVHAHTSSTITADVIVAAAHGEVLLPRQAAHAIARLAHREQPQSDLDASDRHLLRALSDGKTVQAIAEELHYSERTIRRHLQNLYLRLGVRNRAEAIYRAGRMDLSD